LSSLIYNQVIEQLSCMKLNEVFFGLVAKIKVHRI
jgi:hypothetical protein